MKRTKKNPSRYVDGFVIPIPAKNVSKYQKIAKLAGKVWRDHGAIDYFEAISDDVNVKFGVPFAKLAKLKKGEKVLFSYITYKSKAHRNKVNAKVMKDPRLAKMMDPKAMPFDTKKMSFGGFKIIVNE